MKVKMVIAPTLGHPLEVRHVASASKLLLPYGAGCVAAALRKEGHTVHLEDLTVSMNGEFGERILSMSSKKNFKKIEDYLLRDVRDKTIERFVEEMFQLLCAQPCDWLGFSVLSRVGLPCALLLAKKSKQISNAPVVFGGAFITEFHALNMWENFLRKHDYIDYMVIGDGEIPALKLTEHLQGSLGVEGVPNLIYRKQGQIIMPKRVFYDIQDASVPDYATLNLDDFRQEKAVRGKRLGFPQQGGLVLPYQLSRGCSQRCSFCNYFLVEPKIQTKDCLKVLEDLKHLKDRYHSSQFFFCEARANTSYEYLDKLCDALIQSKLDITWSSVVGVNHLDRQLIEKMKKSGCYSLTWGIESGSDRILEVMNKGYTAREAGEILRISHEAGIYNYVNFITGFIHETQEDIDATIRFMSENARYINRIRVFDFALVCQTPIFLRPDKYGIENIALDYQSNIGFSRIRFDETNGLHWQAKLKQQSGAYKRVTAAAKELFMQKTGAVKRRSMMERGAEISGPSLLQLLRVKVISMISRGRKRRGAGRRKRGSSS